MTKKTNIIRAMKGTASLQPCDDFTSRVMEQIVGHRHRSMVMEAFFRPRQWKTHIDTTPKSRAAYTYTLFLAAFGYFMLAGILLAGFQKFAQSPTLPPQVILQPWVLVGIATFFALAGIISHSKRPFALHLIKIGLLIFLGFSAVNGIDRKSVV